MKEPKTAQEWVDWMRLQWNTTPANHEEVALTALRNFAAGELERVCADRSNQEEPYVYTSLIHFRAKALREGKE